MNKEQLAQVAGEQLYDTLEPNIYRTSWRQLSNGAQATTLFSFKDRAMATPVLTTGGDQENALNEGIQRIKSRV